MATQETLAAHDIVEGEVIHRHGVSVSAFMVQHGNVAPAFGYRIDYGGRSVVLSGDTNFSEHLIDKAAGADLLIHEVAAAAESASTPNTARVLRLHTSPEEAGTVFTRVHPKLAVYSHIVTFGVTDDEFVARTRRTYSGPLVVGADLMSFDVTDVVTMTPRPRSR